MFAVNVAAAAALLLAASGPAALAWNPSNCNYEQQMAPGVTYYVYSPNYERAYPAYTDCAWFARTEVGARITLQCTEFDVAATTNCQRDSFDVSRAGDRTFRSFESYCGARTFTAVSNQHEMALRFRSGPTSTTSKNRFICTIRSKRVQSNCNCGTSSSKRIVGGVETYMNEFPYMALIFEYVGGNEPQQRCGATIISERFALTAAHCVHNKDVTYMALLVGDHNIQKQDTGVEDMYALAQKYTPNFSLNTYYNDIAVVRTQQPIAFIAGRIGHVCLPKRLRTSSFQSSVGKFLGWGTTEFSGVKSTVLRKVDVTIQGQTYCRNNAPKMNGNAIVDSQLCTYEYMKDACSFDSGGPLLYRDSGSGRYLLVGIISYGSGCASQSPAVNTRVTSFLDWIEEVTATDFCTV